MRGESAGTFNSSLTAHTTATSSSLRGRQNLLESERVAAGRASSRRLLGSAADWRCVDSPDYAPGGMGMLPVVEYHSADGGHGDVCRNPVTKDYFCPLGCEHAPGAPYCRSSARPDKPCRQPQGEAMHSRCTRSSEPSASLGTPARQRALLERYGSASSHGDVCRDAPQVPGDNAGPSKESYFCPVGCRAVDRVPYCLATIGGTAKPCRIVADAEVSQGGTTTEEGGDGGAGYSSYHQAIEQSGGGSAAGGGSTSEALKAQLTVIRKDQRAAAALEDYGRVVALQHEAEGVSARLDAAVAEEKAALEAARADVKVTSSQLTSRLTAALNKLKYARDEAAAHSDTTKVGFQGVSEIRLGGSQCAW